MEEMNVEVMLESLMIVFNSNEDIFFDFFCWIDVGVIKYFCGGMGVKMFIVVKIIVDKRFIIKICNFDNMCFIWVVFVSLVNVCKIYKIEFDRVKICYFILMCGEIFVFY